MDGIEVRPELTLRHNCIPPVIEPPLDRERASAAGCMHVAANAT